MSEELTKGAGVGGQPTGAEGAVGGAAGEPVQPTAEAQQPIAEQKKPVDLTQSDEFRRWQAARDRREAQLQAQLAETQRQMQEMQRQIETARLADAEPEQVAQYYQQQMEQMRTAQEQEAIRAQERAAIMQQATELLADLQLSADTPGLEWSEEPSWDGLARLARSAAKIKTLQAEALTKEQRTVVDQATQAARTEALTEAGVTKVNTATGTAAPRDLRAEFEAEKAKLRHSGDVGAYARLKSKYRKQGLDV